MPGGEKSQNGSSKNSEWIRMRVIGLISGTSYDGIDVAAVELALTNDVLELKLLGCEVMDYDFRLRDAIAAALPPQKVDVGRIARLDAGLGQAFGKCAAHAVATFCGGFADLIVSHGQTVFHWQENGRTLGSLQLGDAAWIAERTGLPVVSGLRTRDIAAGGEGAPLVSMFDMLLLSGNNTSIALNIGGIANITVIRPDAEPIAYDTGPGNAMIDAAIQLFSDGKDAYDADGAWAASGKANQQLLGRLMGDDFLRQVPPKSTGRERYNLRLLTQALEGSSEMEPADVLATVTEMAVRSIVAECHRHRPSQIVVSGGGRRNGTIMRGLKAAMNPVPIRPSDGLGIPTDAKEAIAFAVLGYLTVNGLPGTIPSCTGATHATLLGAVTPGRMPLQLPPTVRTAPRRLSVIRDMS
jgi:anhydro-N-acetylmuramic acid kinase